MGLGDYFAGFLTEQCRALDLTVEEVDVARFGESYEAPIPARPAVPPSAVKAIESASWRDSSFSLLAPTRSTVSLYRIRLWPQLVIQADNRIEFESFQKAYWLLTDPALLKRHGQRVLPEIQAEWWDSRQEATEVGQFESTIRGAITGNQIRLIEKDGTRYIEALDLSDNKPTPEVIDDARVALQTAESLDWAKLEIPAEIKNHSLEFEVVG